MIFVCYICMKLSGIISFILVFIYSVSIIMGVGIIRCGCKNSQRLVVMSFHPSCLCSDSADDCCRHNDWHHHEDEDPNCQDEKCCSFVYKSVDVDHLNVSQFNDYVTKVFSLLFLSILPVNHLMGNIKECAVEIRNNSPPLCLLKILLIYMNGQLRL